MKKNIILATLVLSLGAVTITSCSSDGGSGMFSSFKSDGLNKNPDDIRAMAFYQTELSEDESAILPFESMRDEKTFNQLDAPVAGDLVAIIETSEGTIKVKLLPDIAPKAVKNFVEHSLNDYYDGLEFHRVIDEFMIQGGDPEGTGRGGESIWGKPFVNEVNVNARHFSGALAMANSGSYASNGSQFYLVDNIPLPQALVEVFNLYEQEPDYVLEHLHTPIEGEEDVYHEGDLRVKDLFPQEVIDGYKTVGGFPNLDFGYTVFGQTYEGLEVIDAISQTEKDENDKPLEPVIIEDITIGIVK